MRSLARSLDGWRVRFYASLADAHPSIARGWLFCHKCGRFDQHDSRTFAGFFASGWPRCCGETMSLDSPRERQRLAAGSPETESPQP